MNGATQHNVDRTFFISSVALHNMREEANTAGSNVRRVFRDRAWKLANCRGKPRYNLSGGELNCKFTAGVSDTVYARLAYMAERMGVPVNVIGELIATAIVEVGHE